MRGTDGGCEHDYGEALLALAAGDLPEAQADPQVAALEAHVAECASCRAELDWLRTERALFQARTARQPGRAAAPPPAVWAAIEQQVSPARARLPRLPARRWGLAAGLAAAALLLVLSVRREHGVSLAVRLDLAPGSATPVVPGTPPSETAIDGAVNDYESAIARLQTDYAARRPSLPPVRVREYDRKFAQLRRVVDDARQTAGRDTAGRRRVLKAYAGYMRTMKTVLLEEEGEETL